jgi:hypothetical protein
MVGYICKCAGGSQPRSETIKSFATFDSAHTCYDRKQSAWHKSGPECVTVGVRSAEERSGISPFLLARITSLAEERIDMDVHLIDGTYELFRHFFAVPRVTDTNGQEIGAVRGVLNSVGHFVP